MKKKILLATLITLTAGACTKAPEVIEKENIIENIIENPVYLDTTDPNAVTLRPVSAEMKYWGWYQSYMVLVDKWYLVLSDAENLEYDLLTDRYSGGSYVLVLCLHTVPSANQQNPSYNGFESTYTYPSSDYDIFPGEYEVGYSRPFDTPYHGTQYQRFGSYFVDLTADEYEADYLEDGSFTIKDLGEGRLRVSGTMSGSRFTKRTFEYEGGYSKGDFGISCASNSTLQQDISLTNAQLPNIVIRDDGHPFGIFMTDKACRNYYVYLYEDGVEFDQRGKLCGGKGSVMLLNLYVDWEADGKIPEGSYTLTDRNENYSIDRDKGVPFRFVQGYPYRFSSPQGCWYFHQDGEHWSGEYAMITDGSLMVSYPEGKLRIEADLLDCSNPAKHININWQE